MSNTFTFVLFFFSKGICKYKTNSNTKTKKQPLNNAMGDSEKWEEIRCASLSGMTHREVAASLNCSTGLVTKVLQREKLGELEPRRSTPLTSKFQEKHRTLLAALVKYEQDHHVNNRTVQQMFSQFSHQCDVIFGEECPVKLDTFSKYLRKIHKFSKHKVSCQEKESFPLHVLPHFTHQNKKNSLTINRFAGRLTTNEKAEKKRITK